MKEMTIWVTRIYITESAHILKTIVNYLKDEAKVRGFSVFRAIGGYGQTGNHSLSLLDLSLDLPLVIEFFEEEEKAKLAQIHLNTIIKAEHIITWPATTYV